ncbi:hypothetical protein BDU57DRAFT_522349 [Ampelomyces quisqualis]|uniref:Uncharacterized protein n=1 Tax=Ampelomyces quisqualis TaxID=50730 RepID=A0A6A5QBL0_AMPQU|nr:hypothetical protein BDU57DRAFT_522349 [Ampelomyces quisqualis]
MPRNSGTVHHCPGRNGWVGNISPGNCHKITTGVRTHCTTHSKICEGPCDGKWAHLKNQPGCLQCKSKWDANERNKQAAIAKAKEDAKKKGKDDWFHETKGRKK